MLRPRSSWEAVDLGCALARRQWGKLMRGWLTVALPLWAIIAVLCRHNPGWAMFFFWWTKPVLTRQPVWFMSRALFGPPPRAREFWRDWRGSLCRGLIAALTWRRFAFQRSFRLPVITLEGQSGTAYTRRVGILSGHGGSSAAWLSFIALKLEFVVALGLTLYLNSYLPEGMEEWMTGLGATSAIPDWFWWVSNLFYVMAIALIEPMYGAAGFALYINTRTHLEGWDIEVAFRRMSSRLTSALAAAVCVMLGLTALQENASAKSARPNAKAIVEEIKKGPDFELEKRKVPVTKYRVEEQTPDKIRESHSPAEHRTMGDLRWLGYALIATVIFVAAYLLWQNRIALRRGREGGDGGKSGPRVVMGMDLAPESLPEDIPQAAWREYQAGRPDEALRLLYRGALAWLVDRAALPVHESDTEGDCLRHTQQLSDTARVSFFESLTAAWINCAYAEVPPAAAPMKQLCDHWPFSLRQRADVAPARTIAAAWLLIPLAALLFQGCGGSSDNSSDMEVEEKVVGYKGAAKANPWLAAQRTLEQMGTPAETRTALGALPETDTVLFLPLEAINSRGAARQMVFWASRGGHLIVACSGTDRFRNDWHDRSEPDIPQNHPLLEELRVNFLIDGGTPAGTVDFGDGDEMRFASHTGASLDVSRRYPDIAAGSAASTALASFRHNGGRITLLASATPFRNRWLDEQDHAAILHQIIHLENAASVLFISSSKVNLWGMLMEHAWMPLTATVLLIAFWLWRHLPRFGPAIPPDYSSVRHFGTQLDEAGTFLYDRAGPAALLASARKSVLQAAVRNGLRSDAPDFMEQLAARSGLPAATVQHALTDISDKADIITAAATLQKCRMKNAE